MGRTARIIVHRVSKSEWSLASHGAADLLRGYAPADGAKRNELGAPAAGEMAGHIAGLNSTMRMLMPEAKEYIRPRGAASAGRLRIPAEKALEGKSV